jgi:hypothetical protein
LPGWLSSLDEGAQALARRPLIHGTDEGSATARMIFDQSLTVETYPLACLAALWICIYGTPHLPGFGLSMDDLQAAAGHGVITINVSRDRSAWNFHLAGRDVEHGGCKTLTPVATATATEQLMTETASTARRIGVENADPAREQSSVSERLETDQPTHQVRTCRRPLRVVSC